MISGMRYKTVLLLGLVLLVMVTLACSSSPPSPPDTAETAYDRGMKYHSQGDYENAIEAYDVAIKLDQQYVNVGFDIN